MKCLVYCILRDEELPYDRLPVGVDGNKVSLLRDDGLVGVFSMVDDARDVPEMSRVKVYEAVIETLHRLHTVLPMRYGCLLPSETHLKVLLRECRQEFLGSLDEVQDCVEMVLHLCLGAPESTMPDHASDHSLTPSPGMAHLTALKRHYAQLDTAARSAEMVTEKCREAFEGLFVKWKAEHSPLVNPVSHAPTLRLFFLVKRENQEVFRNVYRDLALGGTVNARLSGPWPPHNFVQPER